MTNKFRFHSLMKMLVTLTFIVLFVISAGDSQVTTHFFTKANPSLDNRVNLSDPDRLLKAGFLKDKDTFILIHGYMERPNSLVFRSSNKEWKDVLLSKYDVNVVVVDYGRASSTFYPIAVENVEPIARIIATMIKNMEKNSGLDLKKTKMVGISLGAQIAGVIGNKLKGEVDYIIGVDPARPLFTMSKTSNRLSKSSARFVQVIHTNGGRFGMFEPMGHADYYVNGGRTQPTCGLDQIGLCSHVISAGYYSESLTTGNFKAKKCDSYERFQRKTCKAGNDSWMGEYNVDKK